MAKSRMREFQGITIRLSNYIGDPNLTFTIASTIAIVIGGKLLADS